MELYFVIDHNQKKHLLEPIEYVDGAPVFDKSFVIDFYKQEGMADQYIDHRLCHYDYWMDCHIGDNIDMGVMDEIAQMLGHSDFTVKQEKAPEGGFIMTRVLIGHEAGEECYE